MGRRHARFRTRAAIAAFTVLAAVSTLIPTAPVAAGVVARASVAVPRPVDSKPLPPGQVSAPTAKPGKLPATQAPDAKSGARHDAQARFAAQVAARSVKRKPSVAAGTPQPSVIAAHGGRTSVPGPYPLTDLAPKIAPHASVAAGVPSAAAVVQPATTVANPCAGPTLTPPAGRRYGATYSPASSFSEPPTYFSTGLIWVQVTNTSNFTWTASGFMLRYDLFHSDGSLVNCYGTVLTPFSSDVAPGATVNVLMEIQKLPAGTYLLVFNMDDDYNNEFTSYGVPASAALQFTVPHYAPSASISSPAAGASLDTLTPQLVVDVYSDGTMQTTDEFRICIDEQATACADSGPQVVDVGSSLTAVDVWKPPVGALYWNRTYYWQVRVMDQYNTTPWSQMSPLSTVVAAAAGAKPGPGHPDPAGVDLFQGNYTRTETDISVPVFDTAMTVTRTYNSVNTTAGAFGPGWSSLLDLKQVSNADGSLTVTYPDGRAIRYEQNPDSSWAPSYGTGDEAQSVSKGSIVMSDNTGYGFDANGLLSAITTPSGDHIGVTRNTAGQITTLTAGQRSVYVAYTAGGTVASLSTSATVPPPRAVGVSTWTYTYTGGRLTSVCNPRWDLAACTSYDYNGPNNVLSALHAPNGGAETTQIAYDSATGRVARVTFPDAGSSTGDYWYYQKFDPVDSGAAFVIQATQPNGLGTEYEYGPAGDLWTRWTNTPTPLPSNSRAWTYDNSGRVAAVRDENGNVTDYNYDGWGRLADVDTFRDANTLIDTHYEYWTNDPGQPLNPADPRWGRPTRTTDPNGNVTVDAYTTRGILSSVTTPPTAAVPNGGATTYTYTCDNIAWSTNGGPPSVNDPWNSTLGQPCGLLASVTDPMGRATRYSYDSVGEQTRVVSPTGVQTDMTYDGFGHVVRRVVSNPGGAAGVETDYTYDGSGDLLTELDPAILNQVTNVTHRKTTTNVYDADGNLKTSTVSDTTPQASGGDAPRVTQYTYDLRSRRTRSTVDGKLVSASTYDGMGNLAASFDGNGTEYDYTYSPQGWLYLITMPYFVDDPSAPTTPRSVNLEAYYYDPAGRLQMTTDAMGHSVTYTYSGDNLKLTETFEGYKDTPSSAARELVLHNYTYDNDGDIIKDAAGGGARVTTSTYDSRNSVLTSTVDPGGLNRTTTTGYNPAEQPVTKTLTDGTRTESSTNLYAANGQLWQQSVHNDATPDLVNSYVRDGIGQVVASTDPRGVPSLGSTAMNSAYTTTNTYDALDRLVATTSPSVQVEDGSGAAAAAANPSSTRGYDTFGELTDVKDARGAVTHTVYDDRGHKTEVDYPTSNEPDGTVVSPTEKWTYDGNGNVLTHTDRLGQITKTDYDKRNRAYRITAPPPTAGAAAPVTRMAYDDDGNLLSQIDPTGAQTLRTYDPMERVSTIVVVERYVSPPATAPAQYTTSYGYDVFGDVTSATTPSTSDIRTFNNAGELLTDTPSGRGTTTYTRDLAGRPISVKDPVGRHIDTAYDLAGRRTTVTSYDASGAQVAKTTYTSDADGNVTGVTDPNNHLWQALYDAADQLTLLTDPAPTDANGHPLTAPTTSFGYDLNGNRTRVSDANGYSTYTRYDAWNLASVTTAPSTTAYPDLANRRWSTSYNAAGLPTTQVQPGGVTVTDSYDQLGQLTTSVGSGAETASMPRQFGYDADGRLTSINAPYGTETFTYDDRGLLVAYGHPSFVGDGTDTYVNQYDADGRLTARSGAAGTTDFTYDTAGAVATVTDPLTGVKRTYSYDPAGQLSLESDTTAAATVGPEYQYTYDGLGRPKSETAYSPTGATAGTLGYTWDGNGNLTSTSGTGQLAQQPNRTYTYDADNRLITAKDATTETDYGWDGAGNRTSATAYTLNAGQKTNPSATTSSFDQRDRLLSSTGPAGTTTYQYTARGPLSSQTTTPAGGGGATTLTDKSDAYNELVVDGTTSHVNAYDALGRATTANGDIMQYDGLGAEPVADGQWLFARDLAGDPIAAKPATGGSATGLLTNAHNDVIGATDPATGNVLSSQVLGPFGETVSRGTGMPPLGFQGGWTDSGTGNVLAGSRWYNPGTGTFLAQDSAPGPIGGAADANLYAYGSGNPTSRVDPTGHGWGLGVLDDIDTTFNEMVSTTLSDVGTGLSDFGSAVGDAATTVWDAGAEVADAIPEVADAAGAALVDAGIDIGVGVACIIGCLEALAIGVGIVVLVGGVAYLLTANSDGSLSVTGATADPTADHSVDPRADKPRPDTTPTAAPPPSPGNPPGPLPPPVVVGTSTNTHVKTWSTVTSWYNDTYLYTRTDTYVQTTTTVATYYSDGSRATDTTTTLEHTWETIAKLLFDLSNPIVLQTPAVGNPTAPNSDQGVAAADGTCGQGGSLMSCLLGQDGDPPPGLLDFGGAMQTRQCTYVPDGFQCTADGNWLNTATGETICAQGGAPACIYRLPSRGSARKKVPPALYTEDAPTDWTLEQQLWQAARCVPTFTALGLDGKKSRDRTYVGAVNKWTGQIAIAASGDGYCAEGNAVNALGGDPMSVVFTQAFTVEEVGGIDTAVPKPVCANRCQSDYTGIAGFMTGVSGEAGGLWQRLGF